MGPADGSPFKTKNGDKFSFLKKWSTFLLDDHSRVILQPVEDDPSSDYINANYIDVSELHRFPLFLHALSFWLFVCECFFSACHAYETDC